MKQFVIYAVLPCVLHDSLILAICSLAHALYINLLVQLAFHTLCTSQVVFEESQENLIREMMLLFVQFTTSPFLGKVTERSVRYFICP